MGEQSKTVGQPWHTCEETSECTACDDAVNPRKAAAFAMGWLSNVLAEGLGERGWQLAEPKIRDVLRFIESAAAPKVEREGLSIQQLNECARDAQIDFCMDKESSFEVAFARRIEAAHGIATAHGERREGE